MTDQQGLRVVFAGTPDFAATHLAALIAAEGINLVAVYSQPDRPAGRGKKMQASPVKKRAEQAGIEIQQPLNFKDSATREILANYNADVLVVVAYGLLLPQTVLSIPRLGCINVHASLLPRWRGAAPIQRAIEAGDDVTGITIMQMDIGLDTGAMLAEVQCPIYPEDTAQQLHDRLAKLGPAALLNTLDNLARGTVTPVAQDDSAACYAAKLTKEEAQLNWQQHAHVLQRRIRAFNPFPVAYTVFRGERLRILNAKVGERTHQVSAGQIIATSADAIQVACGDGTVLHITEMQLPGKKALAVADILNGAGDLFQPGTILAAS